MTSLSTYNCLSKKLPTDANVNYSKRVVSNLNLQNQENNGEQEGNYTQKSRCIETASGRTTFVTDKKQ